MIKRLVTFGCSNTFGEALPDKWDYENKRCIYDDQPSKYAWPQKIADILEIDCKNLASPGVSNKFIVNRALETDYQEGDVVIFLWTFFTRTCMFRDDGTSKRMMIQDIRNSNIPRARRKFAKGYYSTYYTDTNAIIETYMHINLAKHYLDSIGIKNFHYTCDGQGRANIDLSRAKPPKWTSVILPRLRMTNLDAALDRNHPGVKTQENFAEKIIEHANLRDLL